MEGDALRLHDRVAIITGGAQGIRAGHRIAPG
jgi:hypothetical protein